MTEGKGHGDDDNNDHDNDNKTISPPRTSQEHSEHYPSPRPRVEIPGRDIQRRVTPAYCRWKPSLQAASGNSPPPLLLSSKNNGPRKILISISTDGVAEKNYVEKSTCSWKYRNLLTFWEVAGHINNNQV